MESEGLRIKSRWRQLECYCAHLIVRCWNISKAVKQWLGTHVVGLKCQRVTRTGTSSGASHTCGQWLDLRLLPFNGFLSHVSHASIQIWDDQSQLVRLWAVYPFHEHPKLQLGASLRVSQPNANITIAWPVQALSHSLVTGWQFVEDWVLLNIMIFIFAGTNLAGSEPGFHLDRFRGFTF